MKIASGLLIRLLCFAFLLLPNSVVSFAQDAAHSQWRQVYMRNILEETTDSRATAPLPSAVPPVVSVNDLSVPANARKKFEKGRDLFLKHRPEESIDALGEAVRIAPSFSKAYYLLGLVYMSMHKWSDAEPALRKTALLDDAFGFGFLTLGSCLFEEGKFTEAEEPLLRGTELNPDISGGHYDLARTYYALNRFQDAEEQARKAVALTPEFPDGHMVLGYSLLRIQKTHDALDELQAYLRLSPDGPLAAATRTVVNQLEQVLAAKHETSGE